MSAIFQQAVLDSDATKVKFLFKYARGIRVDQANKNGMTALQQASWDGNVELVNFLLENGADLTLVDREGRSALHLAAQAGHLEVVSLLVNSACADVNAKTERGEKPIDLAKTDQIRALLSQVMLADNLKQRCTLAPLDSDWDTNVCSGKLNVPGSRYSISSTSTDSGVLEDFVPSESYFDTKYSCYSKAGNVLASEPPQSHESFSDLPQSYSKEKSEYGEVSTAVRRTNAVCARGKSQSFSGRHDYATIYEVGAGNQCARVERTVSSPERERHHKRNPKLSLRDPSRRKTVTFGENESRTISYETFTRPRSSSLRRTTISSYAERSAIPTCYSSEQATPGTVREAGQDHIETAESSPPDYSRSHANSQTFAQKGAEKGFCRDSKHRKHVLPGYLTKTLH